MATHKMQEVLITFFFSPFFRNRRLRGSQFHQKSSPPIFSKTSWSEVASFTESPRPPLTTVSLCLRPDPVGTVGVGHRPADGGGRSRAASGSSENQQKKRTQQRAWAQPSPFSCRNKKMLKWRFKGGGGRHINRSFHRHDSKKFRTDSRTTSHRCFERAVHSGGGGYVIRTP